MPLAILEPVKPLGFYLTAKGLVSGGSLIAMGEIVKVTLVEQVIDIAKPKLLSFHWFAWMYRPLGSSAPPAALDKGTAVDQAENAIHVRSGAADGGGYGCAIIS